MFATFTLGGGEGKGQRSARQNRGADWFGTQGLPVTCRMLNACRGVPGLAFFAAISTVERGSFRYSPNVIAGCTKIDAMPGGDTRAQEGGAGQDHPEPQDH